MEVKNYGRVQWLKKDAKDQDFIGTYQEFKVKSAQDSLGLSLHIGPFSLGLVDVATLRIILDDFMTSKDA